MAGQAELDGRIARLEAALVAAETALAALQDGAGARAGEAAALKEAQDRIATLEEEARMREADLDAAVARAEAAEAAEPEAMGDEALVAKIAELRAARAQDLAEMKALLAELEPMLETTDA